MRDQFNVRGDNAQISIYNGPVAGGLIDPAVRSFDVDSPSFSEFDLITARRQAVPYVKSTQDGDPLEELTAWCRVDTGGRARVLARLLTGNAGSGKTRLAVELCQVMGDEGWSAGFASSDQVAMAGGLPMHPLLIVFDYTELNTHLARRFLQRAIEAERERALTHPVRVVLVARSEGEWLADLSAVPAIKTLLGHHPHLELAVEDFDLAARRAHRDAAFERFTRADMYPASDATIPDVEGEGYETPLMVHIAALLVAKGETLPGPDSDDLRAELLDNLIDREVSHLNDSQKDAPGVNRADIRTALTIATLTTPTPDEAVELFAVVRRWGNQPPHVRQLVADTIRKRYTRPQATPQDSEAREPIAAIEPDLISEHLTATLDGRTAIIAKLFAHEDLRPEHRARLLSLLALTNDHYPEVRNDLDAHLANNLKQLIDDPTAAPSLHELLVNRLPHLLRATIDQATTDQKPEAAAQLAAALDQYPQDPQVAKAAAMCTVEFLHRGRHLVHLSVALGQHLVSYYRDRDEPFELASALNNLAVDLGLSGRSAEALAKVEESASIYQTRATPGNIPVDFVYVLDNLAHQLAVEGRVPEAFITAERAVAMFRSLAERDPQSFMPDLAVLLSNYSIWAGEFGRRKDALVAAEEAVAIYRDLDGIQSTEYSLRFAKSLGSYALGLRRMGRWDKAEQAAKESVKIRRTLAERDPGAFLEELATSLIDYANVLGETCQSEKALAATEEALHIYRDLASQHPEGFMLQLATVLNNHAVELAATDRQVDALASAEEAVSLRHILAEENPDAYLPGLADSLNNLALRLEETGRNEDALTAVMKATNLYTDLVEQPHGSRYLPNYATSLHSLAFRLGNVGRLNESLEVTRMALKIRRGLVSQLPEAFLPDLASTLNVLSWLLRETGQFAESLEVGQEAAQTYRGLCEQSPDVYRSDLVKSLQNLLSILMATGQIEEVMAVASEIGEFGEIPVAWTR